MSLFGRESKLKWKGEDYTLIVTMMTIDKVESSGINILETAMELDSGKIPKLTTLARLYQALLSCAGCKATVEQVYESMASDSLIGDFEIMKAAKSAILLFFPELDSPERGEHVPKKTKQ
jgi:hypothetical protein